MSRDGKYLRTFRTIGLTGVSFVINYLITLFLMPFITRTVGTEAYGFVTLAKNCAQYATYLTIALNSFSTRYIALAYHRKDFKQANVYFSSTFYGDLILGSLITVVLLGAVIWLDKIFVIPETLVTDVKILFLLVFLKFWFNTISTAFQSGAFISNKLDTIAAGKGISYLIEAAVLLGLFYAFHAKLYFVGIGLFIGEGFLNLLNVFVCRKYTKELHVRKADFSPAAVKTLVVNGIWAAITSMGAFLMNGLDLMISNLMLTPYMMGQLAIAQSIDTIIKGIYSMSSQAFKPMLLKSYSRNDMPALLKEMKLSMSVTSLLSNLSFSGFFALGMVYYQLWIPDQELSLIFPITLIIISTSISNGIVSPLFYAYSLTVKKMIPCMMTIISGLLNVVSMYFLLRFTDLGLYAVVGTTAVLSVLLNFVGHLLYAPHVLGLPWYTFYPHAIRCLLSCAALCVLFKGLSMLYTPSGWISFIVCAAVYAALGTMTHFLVVFDRREITAIIQKVKRRIH